MGASEFLDSTAPLSTDRAAIAPTGIDHVAWTTPDTFQMELLTDRLAQHNHQLSKPFTKHGPGANVDIYFHDPSGHRFEYNTGMATLESDCPEGIYRRSEREGGSSLWGGY